MSINPLYTYKGTRITCALTSCIWKSVIETVYNVINFGETLSILVAYPHSIDLIVRQWNLKQTSNVKKKDPREVNIDGWPRPTTNLHRAQSSDRSDSPTHVWRFELKNTID